MHRTLGWHLESPQRVAASVGPLYWLDRDYEPVLAWVLTKRAPSAQAVRLDLLVDGVSLFAAGTPLVLPAAQDEAVQDTIIKLYLQRGQHVSLDVLQWDPSVGDVTVGLELEG